MGPETEVPIEMGHCVDCSQPWSMTDEEKRWWLDRIRLDGAHFPKRCATCRKRRTAERAKEQICSNSIERFLDEYNAGSLEPGDFFIRLTSVLSEVKLLEARTRDLSIKLRLATEAKGVKRAHK